MNKIIVIYLLLIIIIVLSIYKSSKRITEGYANKATTYSAAAESNNQDSGSNNNTSNNNPGDNNIKYKYNDIDVTYHGNLQASGSDGIYNTTMGTSSVYDIKHKIINVTSNPSQGNIVYYQPGSFLYGATSYVPHYEDSVFLSRGLNNKIMNTPTFVSNSQNSGLCNLYKNSPIELEQKCNLINDDICASTNCCVLLGGQKCVAGNENGPTMKSNYSDFLILNKDFYYYQGKCYGNCPYSTTSVVNKQPYIPGSQIF
jgi:hypothetical protein